MNTYLMPCASSSAASARFENSGLNLEYGAERTSTRYSTSAVRSASRNSGIERAP